MKCCWTALYKTLFIGSLTGSTEDRNGMEWKINECFSKCAFYYLHSFFKSLSKPCRVVPCPCVRGHEQMAISFCLPSPFLYAIATVMRSFILFVNVVVVLVDILMGLGGGRPPPRCFVLGVREGSSPPSLHCCQHGGRPDIEFRPTTSAWARNGPLLFLQLDSTLYFLLGADL